MTVDPSHPRPPEEDQPGYPSSTHTPPPPAYVAHTEPRKPTDGPLVAGSDNDSGSGGSNVNRWLVMSLVLVSLIAIGLLIYTFTRDSGDSDEAAGSPSETATTSHSEEDPDGDHSAGAGDGPSDGQGEGSDGNAGADPAGSGDGQGDGNGAAEQTDPTALAKALPSRDPDIFWAEGKPDAPLVVTEFADFRCIHCAHWFFEGHQALKPYIDEGKVRVEARTIPLFGADSVPAVIAAWVAGQEGKYFEYAQGLFQATVDHNADTYSEQGLKDLAEQVGLDKEAFSTRFDAIVADLESVQENNQAELSADTEAMMDLINTNYLAFQQLGFTGTPAFVVGEELVKGALPWEQFQQVVEQELAK